MKELSLDESIVKTLGYSGIFDFPLTREELFPRLMLCRTTRSAFTRAVNKLIKEGRIQEKDSYLALTNIDALIRSRRKRLTPSRNKIELARARARLIALHPHVVAVFATGALAVENSPPSDDIDLMIITKPGRLWLTRMFITPALDLFGARRRPESSETNDLLCLNIYLTSSSLALTPPMQNIYSAYELIQARPLVDKSGLSERILTDNPWIRDYLPNYPFPKRNPPSKKSSQDILERLAYRLQYKYMSSRRTAESISLTQAFFHPRPLATDIIAKIKEIK